MNVHGESAPADEGLAGKLTDWGHTLRARVYFADTDFSGVVYHARYLEFFERGRSDYLRLAGIHHNELADGQHGKILVWVVRRMEIDFRTPARIDDILTVDTWTRDISGVRIFMAQKILRDETVLVEAQIEAAVIDGRGRPQRFPKEWIGRFKPSDGPR
jgi:acyl-CoA thioester hydrolase